MATPPKLSYMTIEEYLELDRNATDARYEYLDGQVYMLAGGTLNHATIAFNIARNLHDKLRGTLCRVYTSNVRVELSKARYVYPDVTISCNSQIQGENDIIQLPRLIVEVLSPGTEAYDWGDKFTYYRGCSTLQEYILVQSQRISVEVFKREKNDLWSYQVFGPNTDVELGRIGVQFHIAGVYENVIFRKGDNQPS